MAGELVLLLFLSGPPSLLRAPLCDGPVLRDLEESTSLLWGSWSDFRLKMEVLRQASRQSVSQGYFPGWR